MPAGIPSWPQLRAALLPCRGCLGPLGEGARVGICRTCWEGLVELPLLRCPRCALAHDGACPDPVDWERGDALWDYHGGRPALGALLVPGIKAGEGGWRGALLDRAREAPLPPWAGAVDAVVPVPTLPHRRLLRGFDLAEEWAELLGSRLGRPRLKVLSRRWGSRAQTGRTESERRRLPRGAIGLRAGVAGLSLLLVDDVWTTGATLQRCAQALRAGQAREVSVLTLFRAT